MAKKDSEMLPFKDNETFTIHNYGSSIINQFYQIHSPFLITYEYCSGTSADDYINFITLSEQDRTLFQETYVSHEEFFRVHPPHFHDYFELMIVLEGSVTQKIEDREYRYDAGTCCLITRSLCHFETFNSAASVVFIGLSVSFIQEMFEAAEHSSMREEAEIIGSPLYKFIMNDIETPGQKAYLDFIPTYKNISDKRSLHNWCENLINILMNPHFGALHLAYGTLSSILCYLSDPESYHCITTSLDKSSDFLIFARVERIIQENDGRISRNELSKRLNYSGDYINRIVNKYTGMCLSEYAMKFSLQKASNMLKTSDMSISDIAIELGFSNRTYFYKIFKDKYGVTPKEYRSQHKTEKKKPR